MNSLFVSGIVCIQLMGCVCVMTSSESVSNPATEFANRTLGDVTLRLLRALI